MSNQNEYYHYEKVPYTSKDAFGFVALFALILTPICTAIVCGALYLIQLFQ